MEVISLLIYISLTEWITLKTKQIILFLGAIYFLLYMEKLCVTLAVCMWAEKNWPVSTCFLPHLSTFNYSPLTQYVNSFLSESLWVMTAIPLLSWLQSHKTAPLLFSIFKDRDFRETKQSLLDPNPVCSLRSEHSSAYNRPFPQRNTRDIFT